MSDMGDDFKAWHEESQRKRAKNREGGAVVLAAAHIPFTEHNSGAHLVVCGRWDFWPGTGLWKDRINGHKGRGVFRLVQVVKVLATKG